LSLINHQHLSGTAEHLCEILTLFREKSDPQQTIIRLWLLELIIASRVSDLQMHKTLVPLFLLQQKVMLHRKTAFQLLVSHGRSAAAVHFTTRSFDLLIVQHVCEKSWNALLAVLNSNKFHDASAVLFANGGVPITWARPDRLHLKPIQLIPGLLRSPAQTSCTCNLPWQVEFLKYLVKYKNTSAVKYCFLYLYLEQYIGCNAVVWLDTWSFCLFHLQSALRSCVLKYKSSTRVACAWAYLHLGMHEEAVELALQFDIALAKKFADMSGISLDLQRHVWLGVVKHIIRDRSLAISESADILKERPLSIEDVLPVFPDFVVIDTFKSEISGCLDHHNHSLNSLCADITASTGVSFRLYLETLKLNTRKISLAGRSCCPLSGHPVIMAPFMYGSSCFAYRRSALTEVEVHDQVSRILTESSMIGCVDAPL